MGQASWPKSSRKGIGVYTPTYPLPYPLTVSPLVLPMSTPCGWPPFFSSNQIHDEEATPFSSGQIHAMGTSLLLLQPDPRRGGRALLPQPDPCHGNLRKLRRLILDAKLTPFHRGADDARADLDECPIYFLVTILFPICPRCSSTLTTPRCAALWRRRGIRAFL